MEINLKVGYVIRDVQKTSNPYWAHDRQVSEMMIRAALNEKYAQGSKDRSIRKLNGSIEETVDLAINDKRDVIVLDRRSIEHVKDALESWSAPAEYHAHVLRLEDMLAAALKSDVEKAEKAPSNGAEKSAETAKV